LQLLIPVPCNEKQPNTPAFPAHTRYKDLHNKTELGLRKHEDLLSKREKQMLKIEKERSELNSRAFAAEQEVPTPRLQ
jgi:hypothetical protein